MRYALSFVELNVLNNVLHTVTAQLYTHQNWSCIQ